MIKRVAERLDDSTMKRIASAIKKKQNKLFSVVKSEAEAKEIVQYKDTPLANQESSAYANFAKSGLTQVFNKPVKCAFDEGSVWHVKEIDGVPYIVKEVAEDNEDIVIRKKATASAKEQYKGELDVSIVQLLAKKNIIISAKLVDEIKDKVLSKALKMPSMQKLIEEYATKEFNNG